MDGSFLYRWKAFGQLSMQTSIFISPTIIHHLVHHCISQLPYEACGFLLGTTGYFKTIFGFKEALNKSSDLNRFIINPYDYYKLEKSLQTSNLFIIGFYHSHPLGTPHPSRFDIQDAWVGYSYVILSLEKDHSYAIKSWQINPSTGSCEEEPISTC